VSGSDYGVSPLAADFTGNGKLDFAIDFCESVCAMEVFLGNGAGTFAFLDQLPGSLTFFAAGDFNGDGILDLVGTNCVEQACAFYIELGNGDGTFTPPGNGVALPVPSGQIVTGDFNGDGHLDVAIQAGTSGLYVFLGNGDGTFQNALISNVGNLNSEGGALGGVGDFNGNGNLDVIGVFANNQLGFIQGNGDGTFQTPSTYYSGGANTERILAADLNGDGKLDLITVQDSFTNTFTVFLGNGDGTFQAQAPYPVGHILSGGALGDLNAEGKLDLVLSDVNTQTLILTGNGNGTFQSPIQVPFASADTAVGDFNNDGKLDLVLAYSGYLLQEVPLASIDPSTPVNFGSQTVGTASAPYSVMLSNIGSAVLDVTSIAITGANPSDFAYQSLCGSTLSVNASCQINVTFTPTAGGNRSGALTIASNGITVTDNAGSSPQTVTLTGMGQDFSLASGSSATATISPGQTATYSVNVAPSGGFNQTVSLGCSGAPAQSTCSVSPSSIKLSGTSSSAVMVTVTTAGSAMGTVEPLGAPPSGKFGLWAALAGTLGLAMLGSLGGLRREVRRRLVPCGLAFLCLFCFGIVTSACGGGSSSNSGGGGTQAGSYTLTVTGTFTSGSTTLSQTTKLTLVVQ
jgi:large repetitive protein